MAHPAVLAGSREPFPIEISGVFATVVLICIQRGWERGYTCWFSWVFCVIGFVVFCCFFAFLFFSFKLSGLCALVFHRIRVITERDDKMD